MMIRSSAFVMTDTVIENGSIFQMNFMSTTIQTESTNRAKNKNNTQEQDKHRVIDGKYCTKHIIHC